jgi:ABC-type branched-subunit amino acid transport system substrate-binding protein
VAEVIFELCVRKRKGTRRGIMHRLKYLVPRQFLPLVLPVLVLAASSALAEKNYGPGVTDTEIKIGQTMPYSGPGSAYGTIGKSEIAYVKMINDQGGSTAARSI